MFFTHIDPQSRQLGHDIQSSSLAIIRQKPERNVPLQRLFNESIRPRNQFRSTVENTIHVDQKSVLHQITSCLW